MPAGEAIIIRGIGIRGRIEYRISWIRGELIYEAHLRASNLDFDDIENRDTRIDPVAAAVAQSIAQSVMIVCALARPTSNRRERIARERARKIATPSTIRL